MNILIISLPNDAHSLAVEWALQKKGVNVSVISWANLSQLYDVSYEIDSSNNPNVNLLVRNSSVEVLPNICNNYKSIWLHRITKPVPQSEVSISDHQAIIDNSLHFIKGLHQEFQRTAFTVNPFDAKFKADNKIYQLELASRFGFKIPKTLISNDFNKVREFTRNNDIIIKPLHYMKWKGSHSEFDLKTTKICLEDVDGVNPISISSCPMIYQEQVNKLYEIRAVVFGKDIFAFKIDSQINPDSNVDWRAIDYRALPVEPVLLPVKVNERILNIMSTTGLVTASFDLAYTVTNEYVFFEFNETGQFLWLEEIFPDISLLDIFSEFLISRTKNFLYKPSSNVVHCSDWDNYYKDNKELFLSRNVEANLDKRYLEDA